MTLRSRAALAFVTLALCLAGTRSFAQETPGQVGAGVYIGIPFGGTAKYIIDRNLAVDFALGAQDHDIDAHVDLLTHFRDIEKQPAKGKVAPYLGFGAKIRDRRDTEFGFRFLGGAALLLKDAPIEIFLEIAPVLRVAPEAAGDVDGGVGLRYYFGARK